MLSYKANASLNGFNQQIKSNATAMNNSYSTINGWMIPISRVLSEQGLCLKTALAKCGIEDSDIKDQDSRIETYKLANLFEYCEQKMGRKDVSILVAKQFRPSMFHVLGYAMMSSNTLKDALARIVQYERVVSDACNLELIERDNQLILELELLTYQDTGRPVINQVLCETFMASLVQLSRDLVSHDLNPVRVDFSNPEPSIGGGYLVEFFLSPIRFSTDKPAIVFDLETAETELIGGNPMVTYAHEKMLDDFLSRIDKSDLTYVIKNKIYETLPLGAPSQVDIARELGMSLRNLQRKLQEQGTNYKEILEQTRKKLTLEYIQQSHLSISEIGYLVGFSSVGNFNRAFKRWTSTTPSDYRHNINT